MNKKNIFIILTIIILFIGGLFLFKSTKSNENFCYNIDWNDNIKELRNKMTEMKFYDYENKEKRPVSGDEVSNDNRSSRINIRYIKANSPSLSLNDIPLEWYRCIGFFDDKENITYLEETYRAVDYSFDENLTEYERYEKSYRDLEDIYDSIILSLEDNGAEYIEEKFDSTGLNSEGLLYKFKDHYLLVRKFDDEYLRVEVEHYNPKYTKKEVLKGTWFADTKNSDI